MIPENMKNLFLEWLKSQPMSKTHVRDILTMRKYEYKPIEELYRLFEYEHNNGICQWNNPQLKMKL